MTSKTHKTKKGDLAMQTLFWIIAGAVLMGIMGYIYFKRLF